MDRDALIHQIGMLIVTDPAVDASPWDGYALIVRYEDQSGTARRISGFCYMDGGGFEAATPRNEDLGEALDALREATRVEGKPPWDACVIRIRRDTRKVDVEFEYNAPEQWDITPATLVPVATRARPS